MIKAFIFDLDGTLLDTLHDLQKAVNEALGIFGYPDRSLEQIRRAIGNGVSKLVERSIPGGTCNPDYPDCLKKFREIYKTHYSENTFPYPGVRESCEVLKAKGYRLAVATNKVRDIAVELITDFYPGVFEIIQGDEPGINRKPEPDMIRKILRSFDVSESEAIYVGDTDVDELSARNSGLDYYLVTYGYRTEKELQELCPEAKKINSLSKLIELY